MGLAVLLGLAVAGYSAAAWAQPVVSLQPLTAQVSEGDPPRPAFRVTRTGSLTAPLVVYYDLAGTATNGVEFTRLPGAVTLPSGQSSADLWVEPLNDTLEEPDKTIELRLISNRSPFTLVLLPDTQYYVCCGAVNLDFFASQIRWIAQQKDARCIAFVLHEGDCTDGNTLGEWIFFKIILRQLDGVVPYAIAVGNHDGLMTGRSNTGPFNDFFPVSLFQSLPTFGGVFETNRMDNCYHRFSAGGVDWLILVLEFGPRDEVLAWANQVVAAHPDRRVILLTHTHVYSDETLHGSLPSHSWKPADYGRGNNGVEVWDKLVSRHANIAFVFNGHVLNDGAGQVTGVGIHGNPVRQMLANYQMLPYGGSGYLRVLEFIPAEDRLVVRTYSPALDAYRVHPEHQFHYDSIGIFHPSQATYAVNPASSNATVTLRDDDTDVAPPAVVRATAAGIPPELTLLFSEPVEAASAAHPDNYAVDGGVGVLNATLEADLRTVTLALTDLVTNTTYTVTLNHIRDRARLPNTLGPDLRAPFGYRRAFLEDTFDSPRLLGWQILDEGTRDAPSQWSIRNGRLEQSANLYGPDVSATDHRLGTFAWWSKPAAQLWSNYLFTVTLRSSDDDGIGVLFRYQDSGHYYKLEFDQQRGFRKLFKKVAGLETLLAIENFGYPQEQDLEVRIEVTNGLLRASLDGQVLFGGPVADADLARGSVGLYCWGSAGVQFDNVTVVPEGDAGGPLRGRDCLRVAPPALLTLIPMDAAWRFWEWDDPPDPAWNQPDFDDSDWPGPNPAIFAHEPDPLPDLPNTSLSIGPTAHYFRTIFSVSNAVERACLRLRHLVDDGAVFYLNGLEILRTGMPTNAVEPLTLASREVDNAVHEGPFDIEVTNLRPGLNVVAAELHQSSHFSEDAVFGAELEVVAPRPASVCFTSAQLLPSRQLRLTLPGPAGRVYSILASMDLNSWQPFATVTNVTGSVSFNVNTTPASARFLRALLPAASCAER